MLDKRELFIVMGHSISGSFILALWKMITHVLSVFKYRLLAFNHVKSFYNSWLRIVMILDRPFLCITTLASSAYKAVKSNSDTLHISSIKIINRRGRGIEPCGTPQLIYCIVD